jgi:hypothetical protein
MNINSSYPILEAAILLKLALITNQPINQSYFRSILYRNYIKLNEYQLNPKPNLKFKLNECFDFFRPYGIFLFSFYLILACSFQPLFVGLLILTEL